MISTLQLTDDLFAPPPLRDLSSTLVMIPGALLGWIAQKHLQYLDDRIHRIEELTDYLAGCGHVDRERNDFVNFVESWTRKKDPDLFHYLAEYAVRYWHIRIRVESLCDRLLARGGIWDNASSIKCFWAEYALVNEIDSLHGMFLTSGRWHVNVVLPAVKELIFCTSRTSLPANDATAEEYSYHIARRVITPCFASPPPDYDVTFERSFARVFLPLLQCYDRELLFLFASLSQHRGRYTVLQDFVAGVRDNPGEYSEFLTKGVYPPFAWHELVGSRLPRRSIGSIEATHASILSGVPSHLLARAQRALLVFRVLKRYELNYNNYNYKGRFGLVSKDFYHNTIALLPSAYREEFERTILLDRFFDALSMVDRFL